MGLGRRFRVAKVVQILDMLALCYYYDHIKSMMFSLTAKSKNVKRPMQCTLSLRMLHASRTDLQCDVCEKLNWQLTRPASPLYETLQTLEMYAERRLVAANLAQ